MLLETRSDSEDLRRGVRDLAALSALPALWNGCAPVRIAESAGFTLVSMMLRADFVYSDLLGDRDDETVDVIETAAPVNQSDLEAIGAAVKSRIRLSDVGRAATIANPLRGERLRRAIAPVSPRGTGVIVAGSQAAQFQSDTQRLLLETVANDTSFGLQRWRRETEMRRLVAMVEGSSDFVCLADPPEATAGMDRRLLRLTTELKRPDAVEFAVADSGQASTPKSPIASPSRSSRQSATAWELVFPSAIRSSKRMAAACASNRVPAAGQYSASHSRRLRLAEARMPNERTIHIVDDDAAVRRSIERLLDSVGFATVSYATSGEFLRAAPHLTQGCVLLDVKMPGVVGLEVQARLTSQGFILPIIVITGQGDVQTAVRAMKAGAFDLLEKPYEDDALLTAIEAAFANGSTDRIHQAADAAQRVGKLSPREGEVLHALMAGASNKAIAFDLGLSVRTVEVHRARMMERLGTRQLAEAIRLAVMATLAPGSRPISED